MYHIKTYLNIAKLKSACNPDKHPLDAYAADVPSCQQASMRIPTTADT